MRYTYNLKCGEMYSLGKSGTGDPVVTSPGAALYLLTAEQVAWNGGTVEQLDSIYSRGIAVY